MKKPVSKFAFQVRNLQRYSLGAMTPAQNDSFLRNPRFSGLKFPDMSKPEGLDRKYGMQLPKPAMVFMKALLMMVGRCRLNQVDP